ncbi:MAG: SulP family inorganic anion transporter [Flammeovirgaceae bacterium]|nr:SulP family inorganic anion transporter [Flammeovirgaceae bacterium]
MVESNKLGSLKNDIPASIVVFFVAVPLCLGIALASGAPLFAGIIAGIVGGIVVGIASGSHIGVSGPAAGLAVIVLSSIQKLGTYEAFLMAVVIAGLIQLILGFLRAGIIAYYFPSSVIKGMLSGIGIIIILKQIPHAFGYDREFEGSFQFIQLDGQNTFSELIHMVNYIAPGSLLISIVGLFILILWETSFIKKFRVFQLVQGPLVVVAFGILLSHFFVTTDLEIRDEHLVNIPVSTSLNEFFGQFTLPDFSYIGRYDIYLVAFTIAIVASLETLLCVEASDKMDPQKRITPTNRELRAQGLGNMISGFIGGLPITQVIVRSSANIQSGGKTKASAIFHGVLLLVCAFAIPGILNMIPLACLASILLVVGYKLARPTLFKSMYARGKDQFLPFIATILGIIFTDLLIGIGIGMSVAIFFVLLKDYKLPFSIGEKPNGSEQVYHIELAESVSFLNKGSLLETLSLIPDKSKVIVDATKSIYIDNDVVEIIEDYKKSAAFKDIQFEVKGLEKKKSPQPVKRFKLMLNGKIQN